MCQLLAERRAGVAVIGTTILAKFHAVQVDRF
jgi:hypothetical protein